MPGFSVVKSSRVSDNIASQLKNAIRGGAFKPGEKLPSEREKDRDNRAYESTANGEMI